MSDLVLVEYDQSEVERAIEHWRIRFNTLFLHKVSAIFEIAKEIKAFHDEYNRSPSVWRANWRVVCKQVIGINYTACSHYEKIDEVFNSPMLDGYHDTLPEKTYVLYLIARAYVTSESIVLKALDNGTVTRAMSQDEAKELLALAQDDAGLVEGHFPLFGEEDPPTRRKPKTWRKYKREGPDLSVPDNLEEMDAKDKAENDEKWAALEVVSMDTSGDESEAPEYRLHPVYGPIIKDAGSMKDSALCFRDVHNDVQLLRTIVEEDIIRHVLNARVNCPEFFGIIASWDDRHTQVNVTMALRELGYK